MCFVKTDDPSWPHVLSELPNGSAAAASVVVPCDENGTAFCWSFQHNDERHQSRQQRRNTTTTTTTTSSSCPINNRKRNRKTLSFKDVQERRHQNALPFGQTALCMALQKNLPLSSIRLLSLSDPTVLKQTDDQNGDSPLMYAIRYGNPTEVIKFLTEEADSNAMLYHRNKRGKTCLHLAVEFACATVTDEVRFRLLVPKEEEALECTVLENVSYLVQTAGLAMDMGDGEYDNTPLHLVVQDGGPGRLTVMRTILGALVATQEAIPGSTTHGGALLTQVVSYFLRRYRLHDKQTILHLACQAPNYSLDLVQLILQFEDPTQLIMKNIFQQTPLHILCHMNEDYMVKDDNDDGNEVDDATFSVDHVHKSLIQVLQRIVSSFKPILTRVLTQKDNSEKAPLEIYMKNSFLRPKDPTVLSFLLYNNNDTTTKSTQPISSSFLWQATTDALLSENPNDLLTDCQCFLEDRDDDNYDDTDSTKELADLDPALCCLWLLLNHYPEETTTTTTASSSHYEPTMACRNALEAVQIFLQVIPESKLRQSRYGANLRCVLRIIFHALFAATYREDLMKTSTTTTETTTNVVPDEEYWAHAMIRELQTPKVYPLPLQRIKRGVLNCIYRDSNTVSKVLVLPLIPVRLVALAFPTWTPGIENPSHRFCPFYKPLSFFQYCSRRSSSMSCQLHADAMAYFGPFVTPQTMARRLHILIDLVASDTILFGQDKLNSLLEMKFRLDAWQEDDECGFSGEEKKDC